MSATLEFLNAIQQSAVGSAVAKSNHLVGATAQIFHVLGFIVLLSAVLLTNLRLLGVGLRDRSAQQLAGETGKLIWIGLASAVISGIFMFFSAVELYYFNPAFAYKLLLLVAAVVLQVLWFRKILSTETPNPVVARIGALLSIGLWFSVGLAGRAIGFV
jgi:hypothetical protein